MKHFYLKTDTDKCLQNILYTLTFTYSDGRQESYLTQLIQTYSYPNKELYFSIQKQSACIGIMDLEY